MGVLAGGFGPLVPIVTRRFGIGLSQAGLLFGALSLGGIVAVSVGMRLLEMVRARTAVAAALAAFAAGAAGVALAPSWPLLLSGVALAGFGYGGLDIAFNQFVAHGSSRRRASVQNALHAVYGFGSVAGPPLVAAAGEPRLSLVYGGLAAAVALPALTLGGVQGRLPAPAAAADGLRWDWPIAAFAAAFALYVGVELGTGGWMPTHLAHLGMPPVTAATWTSAYWLAFAVGRLLIALVTLAVSEAPLVLGGSALALVALLLAGVAPLAPAAYVLTGLAIAPVFPTAVIWVAKLNPGNARATAWLFPAAGVGGAILPAGVGAAISVTGVGSTPLVLAALAMATLAVFAFAARSSRYPARQ